MRTSFTLSFIILSCFYSRAQEKLKTIEVNDTIVATAIDRPGDFYVVTKSDQIQKFDKDGKLLVLYKADEPPDLFDPRDGARLFIYYRAAQRYEFRDPSFESLRSYAIDPAFAIQPWLICPSGDHKLWILDKADNSLKKIDVRESEVELEVMVDSTLIGNAEDFSSMREYQNFVFLFSPSHGIQIFNSLGLHIRSLDLPAIENFNFLGEELYYLQGDTIEFFNLFTTRTRKVKAGPGYEQALLTDERMILFGEKTIDIFAFQP